MQWLSWLLTAGELRLPRQVGLVELLATGVVEEVAVGLIGEARIALDCPAKSLGRRWRPGRGTGRRVVPQAAVLEDLADDVFLAGFDEGDDLDDAAALGATQGVGLVDALDEDGPAAAGLGGGWNGRSR